MLSIVQQVFFNNPTNTDPISFALSQPTTRGNTLVVAMVSNVTVNGGVNTVSDNAGNAYIENPADLDPNETTHTDIWYCPNIRAGATTISIFANADPIVWVFELTPCTLDDSRNVIGNPTSPSEVTSAINGTGNDFYLTVIGTGGAASTFPADPYTTINSVSAPWTLDNPTSFGAISAAWTGNGGAGAVAHILNSTGSKQATFAVTPNPADAARQYGSSSISFKESVAPPPPPPPACAPVDAQSHLTSGVLINDLSLFIEPATALYKTPILPSQINAFETTNEGRNAIVLDFALGDGLYARDLGTVFSWPLIPVGGGFKTVLYAWQPSIIPMPEGVYGRATDWMDGGTPGAKFIQGVMIEADSFNNAKTFVLEDSDTLTLHALNETPATFNKQSEIAFSCTPFVAHSARLMSFDGVEWRVWSSRLVFQPWPETCLNWQTEKTSLGLTGWGHVREMNIPHQSLANLTLVLTFDAWPTITLTIPSSGGVQKKTKVTLPPNKFKLMGLRIFSTARFYLFAGDVELKCKQWGSTGAYQVLKPFGGPSKVGALV